MTRPTGDTVVAAMYALYEGGLSASEAAAVFGVSKSAALRNFARRGLQVRPRLPEKSPVIRSGEIVMIPLTGGRANGRLVTVDEGDYEAVSPFRWHVIERMAPGRRVNGPYAQASMRIGGRKVQLEMHKFLTGNPRTDHVNHDGLDNRRVNLRVVTAAQNNYNSRSRVGSSSRFKGVTWNRGNRKWQASIKLHGQNRYLGCYEVEEDAALAYNAAARELFGEHACLNEVSA